MEQQNCKKKQRIVDIAVVAAMALIMVLIIVMNQKNPITYQMLSSSSDSYEKGKVTEILSESLEMEKGGSRYLGTQTLKVKLKTGERKGQEIEVQNELSTTHNVLAGKGQNLIIKVDDPEGVEPYYGVFNYDRTSGILLILVLFAVLMLVIGGMKGLRSMAGLFFGLFLIIGFLLPVIYHGASPIGMGIITAVVITVVSMLLLNGASPKTWTAIFAATAGMLLAVLLYYIFSEILHLSGYNLEEAEELLIIQENTGLQVSQLLFTGILIASLGAVMDMTMSIATSLFEMKSIHPDMMKKEMFLSGMGIGKDMIGTMCQTLVLAFAGTGITALLVLIAYGTKTQALLSSDYLGIELMHSLTGSIAVVMSVPITAGISAFFACYREKDAAP